MATLISKATGNFTDASTWALVDSTSYLDSEAASSALSTAYTNSASFTPGAITIDGVAVKIASVTSGAATFSLELYNVTDAVSVATATINLSDIQNTLNGTAYNRGWVFLKFASNQTLIAGKAYRIGLKLSSTTSQGLTVYRNATAANWSRMLRTTTTQAPASGDQLHVMGEWTGAGSQTAFTVTLDNTATTSFGPTVSGGPPQGITVNKGGTLTCGTASATNYYLKWKGAFTVFDAGVLSVATSGTRLPSSSSLVLEMDVVTNGDTSLQSGVGGVVSMFGYDNVTSASCITALTADEAVSSTSIDVASTSGWANGDEIAIASTTRTSAECEKRTISTVNSSTNVTISSGLTYAHTGTGTVVAEVVHLTRNIKIRGLNATTGCGFVYFVGGLVKMRHVEMYYLGYATRGSLDYLHYPGASRFDAQYCSIHDCEVNATIGLKVVTNGNGSLNSYVEDTSGFRAAYIGMYDVASFVSISESIGTPELEYVCCLLSTSAGVGSGNGILLHNQGGVYSHLTVVGFRYSTTSNSWALYFGITVFNAAHQPLNASYMEVRASYGGIYLADNQVGSNTLSNSRGVRNNIWGIFSAGHNYLIKDCQFFGNTTAGIRLGSTSSYCIYVNCDVYSEASYAQASGVVLVVSSPTTQMATQAVFEGCEFGVGGTHSLGDIDMGSSQGGAGQIMFRGCTLASSTEVRWANGPNYNTNFWVFIQQKDGVSGQHESQCDQGTIRTDTTLYRTASPSMRLIPNAGSSVLRKLTNGPIGFGFNRRVDSGSAVTFNCYVRKSNTGAGDAATYNGNQPRLIVRRNYALGVFDDTVLATATSASDGAWELLSGTTVSATDDGVLEFYVDCDGTVGWINVDDLS